jgi:hypothetical protein
MVRHVSSGEHKGAATMGHPNEDLTRRGYNTLVFHVPDGKVTEVWQYWADPYTADELFA